MDAAGNRQHGHGEWLGTAACWELLSEVTLGRLALTVAALPVIVPVRFCLDHQQLRICVGHEDIPLRALDDAIVAFGADRIDSESGTGWSVQVQGRSRLQRVPGTDRACAACREGPVAHLEPLVVTGRRLAWASFGAPA